MMRPRGQALVLLASAGLIAACTRQPMPPAEKATPTPTQPEVVRAYGVEATAIPVPQPIGGEDRPQVEDVVLGATLSGAPIRLSEFRGRALLVNYWASWCPPCWAEMPELQGIFQDYRLRGLEVVAVNSGETPAAIDSFLERQQVPLTFTIAMDPQQQAGQAQGLSGVPVTVLYDMEGRELRRFTGLFGFNPALIRQDLDRMLDRER